MSDSKATVDKKLQLMREVSDIADELAKGYVKGLRKSVKDADAGGEQKSITPHEMDRVLRIGKQYSERVLLAEGKNTANIGVDGKGGLPFKFVLNKHYQKEDSDQQSAVSDEQEKSSQQSADSKQEDNYE